MLCRGRQYGDPLARSALGECTLLNGKSLWLCTALVGVANLATRRPRNRAVMYNDGRLPYVAALPPTGRQIGDPYGWCGNRMRRLCRRRVVRQLNAAALPPTGRQIGDPYRGAATECGGETASGRYIKVSQKVKRSLPFGMPAMPQPWRCILRGVPQPGETRLGELFCRRTQGTTVVFTACVPSNSSEMEILSGL